MQLYCPYSCQLYSLSATCAHKGIDMLFSVLLKKTMVATACLSKEPVIALFDSGASHCFIEEAYALKLALQLSPSPQPRLMLADGSMAALFGMIDF